MDYTVHRILHARILEWGAFPFSRGSSQPRGWTQVSHIAGRFFTSWATRVRLESSVKDRIVAEKWASLSYIWLNGTISKLLKSEIYKSFWIDILIMLMMKFSLGFTYFYHKCYITSSVSSCTASKVFVYHLFPFLGPPTSWICPLLLDLAEMSHNGAYLVVTILTGIKKHQVSVE